MHLCKEIAFSCGRLLQAHVRLRVAAHAIGPASPGALTARLFSTGGYNFLTPLSSDLEALKAQATARVLHLDTNGDYHSTDIDKQEFAKKWQLNIRDLRAVDPAFRSQMASILAREHLIIVKLGEVRAAIDSSQVFLFDAESDGVEPALKLVQECIRAGGPWALPYEFRALEAMLIYTSRQLEERRDGLENRVDLLAGGLVRNMTPGNLDSLHPHLEEIMPLRQSLGALEHEAQEVRKAIEDVLSCDEDMAMMYLTHKDVSQGVPRNRTEHQELELMLEAYLKQVVEVCNDLSSLKASIYNAEDTVRLQLNAARNRILRLNLLMSGGMMSLAAGSTIAAVFGMNLISHLEASPRAFFLVTGFICIVSTLTFRGYISYCKRKRVL